MKTPSVPAHGHFLPFLLGLLSVFSTLSFFFPILLFLSPSILLLANSLFLPGIPTVSQPSPFQRIKKFLPLSPPPPGDIHPPPSSPLLSSARKIKVTIYQQLCAKHCLSVLLLVVPHRPASHVIAQLQDPRKSPETETSTIYWIGNLISLKQSPGAIPYHVWMQSGTLATQGRRRLPFIGETVVRLAYHVPGKPVAGAGGKRIGSY